MDKDFFDSILKKENKFLESLWELGYSNGPRQIERTRTVALALMTEVAEFLGELPVKEHMLYTNFKINPRNLAEEIVDVLRYLSGLALLWNVDPDTLAEVWEAKAQVVEHRLAQDRFMADLLEQNKPIAVLDLDGVLLDTHWHWFEFLKEKTGNVYKTRTEARMGLGTLQYELFKDEYRRHHKREVPTMPGAVELTRILRNRGCAIVIITARPYGHYSNLYLDTIWSIRFLDYDCLFFDDDKRSRIERYSHLVKIVVEDDPAHAITLSNPWTRTFLVTNPENESVLEPAPIIRVPYLEQILDKYL